MRSLLTSELVYVRETARAGSLSEAARNLNIAPSAISRKISQLERSLGVKLFERERRGMVPTDAGARLLGHIRRMDHDAEQLLHDLSAAEARTERLRVAASDGFSSGLMAEVVATVRERHSRLRVSVESTSSAEAAQRVRDGRADLAVCFATGMIAGVRVEYSAQVPTLALVHEGHPLAGRAAVSLAEVLSGPCAMLTTHSSQREVITQIAEKSGLRVDPVYECDRRDSLLEFARRGGGVVFSAPVGLTPELRRGLVALPLSDPEFTHRTVQIHTSLWRSPSPVQAAFVAELAYQIDSVAITGVADPEG